MVSRILKSLRTDCRGQITFLTAALSGVLLGVMGLVLDGGMLYFERRSMQTAADAGATGGAWELKRGNTDLADDIRPAALNDTGLNGFDDSNATVTVNNPPQSGGWAGNNNFVEVTIARVVQTYFMRIVNFDQVNVAARAVAGLVQAGDACIVALDRDASDALRFHGNHSMTLDNCGIMSNSAAAVGLRASGNVDVSADWIAVTGGFGQEGGSGTVSPAPEEQVPPIWDPLSYVQAPDWNGWPEGFFDSSTNTYVCPGGACVWEDEIKIAGPSGTKTFESGIHVLRDGMSIQSTNVVEGMEVFFYNTGEGGGIQISGKATVTLSAPTSGPYKGILFYTDRNAPNINNDIGRGKSTFEFRGALYFPSQHLDFAGTSFGMSPWGLVIANTLDWGGTNDLVLSQPPADEGPDITRPMLVE